MVLRKLSKFVLCSSLIVLVILNIVLPQVHVGRAFATLGPGDTLTVDTGKGTDGFPYVTFHASSAAGSPIPLVQVLITAPGDSPENFLFNGETNSSGYLVV